MFSLLYPLFFLQERSMMFHLTSGRPAAIVEMALSVWAIIHLADAFDQCDVRHKFVYETGKC